MNSTFRRAIQLATIAHGDQLDKVGKPYIFHPLMVMMDESLTTDDERIVAVLHDVLEDTKMPLSVILRYIGIDCCASRQELIGDALLAITHHKNEPNVEYWARVKANPLARAVKLADIRHNMSPARMSGLPPADQVRMQAKHEAARLALGD